MKRLLLVLLVGLSAMMLLPGCIILEFGGGKKTATTCTTTNSDQHPVVGQATTSPTLGQQLLDLQKAKDSGVITDAEYQAQKAKLLQNK
jgi:hypothetical protein